MRTNKTREKYTKRETNIQKQETNIQKTRDKYTKQETNIQKQETNTQSSYGQLTQEMFPGKLRTVQNKAD